MTDLEALLTRTLAGEVVAWRELQLVIEPTIAAIARRHPGLRRKGLAIVVDDVREITVASLERLARDDFKNLRRFRETSDAAGSSNFDSWLYGAVDYVIRDHLRTRFGRAPTVDIDPGSTHVPSKRDLQTLAGSIDNESVQRALSETLGMTTKLTVAEVFRYVDQSFSEDDARVLRLHYMSDCSFSEIGSALGLEPGSVEKRLRRLNARLRYRFGGRDE